MEDLFEYIFLKDVKKNTLEVAAPLLIFSNLVMEKKYSVSYDQEREGLNEIYISDFFTPTKNFTSYQLIIK